MTKPWGFNQQIHGNKVVIPHSWSISPRHLFLTEAIGGLVNRMGPKSYVMSAMEYSWDKHFTKEWRPWRWRMVLVGLYHQHDTHMAIFFTSTKTGVRIPWNKDDFPSCLEWLRLDNSGFTMSQGLEDRILYDDLHNGNTRVKKKYWKTWPTSL